MSNGQGPGCPTVGETDRQTERERQRERWGGGVAWKPFSPPLIKDFFFFQPRPRFHTFQNMKTRSRLKEMS